jgi:hypothetical protein
MGTRADFYVSAEDGSVEWIGSVAWDGDKWAKNPRSRIASARSAASFRSAVEVMSNARRDFTSPDQGWPWPWPTSHRTDFTYLFKNGRTHVFNFGKDYPARVFDAPAFPDMKPLQRVPYDSPRSGLMFLRIPR